MYAVYYPTWPQPVVVMNGNGLPDTQVVMPTQQGSIEQPQHISQPEQNSQVSPTPKPAATGPRPCKRQNCLADLPPSVVLEKFIANEVPRQHNRGTAQIAQPNKFRTAACKHFKGGHCCYGTLCWMAHSTADLRTIENNDQEGLTTATAVYEFIQRELEEDDVMDLVDRALEAIDAD